MEVTVANYGDQPASNVTVSVEQDGARLPAVVIDEIPAGRRGDAAVSRHVPRGGAAPARRRSLESDAVDDRQRAATSPPQIPAAFPVLVIDGSPEGDDGYYLRNALEPRRAQSRRLDAAGRAAELPAAARGAGRLRGDLPARRAAARRPRGRGAGRVCRSRRRAGDVPRARRRCEPFYNERLYRDGEGLLPAPLDVPAQLLRDSGAATPDVEVTDHPRLPRLRRRSGTAFSRSRRSTSTTASTRSGAAGVGRRARRWRGCGTGRRWSWRRGSATAASSLALCKLSPQPTELGAWSNLERESGVPGVRQRAGRLPVGDAAAVRRARRRRAGALTVDEADYLPEVRVRPPGGGEGDAATVVPDGEGRPVRDRRARRSRAAACGSFELTTRDGKPETRLRRRERAVGRGRPAPAAARTSWPSGCAASTTSIRWRRSSPTRTTSSRARGLATRCSTR